MITMPFHSFKRHRGVITSIHFLVFYLCFLAWCCESGSGSSSDVCEALPPTEHELLPSVAEAARRHYESGVQLSELGDTAAAIVELMYVICCVNLSHL